jgi:hypothetical protein
LRGFDVHGFSFALEWNRGDANEVLSAFNIDFLKREVGEMRVNQDCGFFAELKVFIEKGARKN